MIVGKGRLFNALTYSLFIIIGIVMLYPFWYVLMFSFSDPAKSTLNNYFFLPVGFTLRTYEYMFRQTLIYTGLKNSAIVTLGGTALSLLLTVLTAYPLSKADLKGKRVFLSLFFFSMMFDGGMIPTYLVVRSLGMVNKLWALIVPGALSVFNLLIMIRFFRGIPVSLIETAKIDGYNDMAILFRIILPLSPAALASIGLFYAVAQWNSFVGGIIYINDMDKQVLQVILKTLFQKETLGKENHLLATISTPEHFRMAMAIITMLPILMVYPLLQRYFIAGVMLGSVKE